MPNIITGREHSRARRQPTPGSGWPKYGGYQRAVGTRPFVNDIDAPGMAHGAIVFSEHPPARVLAIHYG